MAVGRIVALDVGRVRIGVAITDPLGYTVQPLLTITRKGPGEDRRNLLRLFRKHGVAEIVIGNPLHMSGEAGAWALEVQALGRQIHEWSGLPVHLWDERLTSQEAQAMLQGTSHFDRDAKGRVQKGAIDQMAAVLILQGWLNGRQQAEARAAWLAGLPVAEPE